MSGVLGLSMGTVLLGRGGLQRIASGLGTRAAPHRDAKTAGAFAEMSDRIAHHLGRTGLAGRPTPPSYGIVQGTRFRPPPGATRRSARFAGDSLATKLGQMRDRGALSAGATVTMDKSSPDEPAPTDPDATRSLTAGFDVVQRMLGRVGDIADARENALRQTLLMLKG